MLTLDYPLFWRRPLYVFAVINLISIVSFAQPKLTNRVAFYVVGHQDDWQLFMGANTYRDVIQPNSKVVLIYTTAGQATDSAGGYWRARETGANYSIAFAANAASKPENKKQSTVQINGHAITVYTYKNTVSYFLRLPDGNTDGKGFPQTYHQSLQKLKDGSIPNITATDKSTTYKSWSDLVKTIQAILKKEASNSKDLSLHIPDTDPSINQGDHPDHVMSGKAALEASTGLISHLFLYTDYNTSTRKPNISMVDLSRKAALFAVYNQALTEVSVSNSWEKYHLAWLPRMYFREIETSSPSNTIGGGIALETLPLDTLKTEEGNNISLLQNEPNPFSTTTTIRFTVAKEDYVSIKVLDVTGKQIFALPDALKAAGSYQVQLVADPEWVSGLYICQLQVGKRRREIKMILNR